MNGMMNNINAVEYSKCLSRTYSHVLQNVPRVVMNHDSALAIVGLTVIQRYST